MVTRRITYFFNANFHPYGIQFDSKVTWMFKISFENMIMIKSFQISLKNKYANDKMMCHYIDNVIIQLFYNDSEMTTSNLI
jgi:hypothetical protein